jgi:hypothetical protein
MSGVMGIVVVILITTLTGYLSCVLNVQRYIMQKKVHSDYRVVVYIDEPWMFKTHRSCVAACNRVESDINRHVDGITHTEIDWDTAILCEFCDNEWDVCEEYDPDCELGEPYCCTEAQREFYRHLWFSEAI